MKSRVAVFALAIFVFCSPIEAQTRAGYKSIEQLADKLEIAYMNSSLGRLDAGRPFLRRVKIVIEHSLAGDTDQDRFEIREFKTLAEGELWLKRREREDGTPFRDVRSLTNCKRGLCRYDFAGGILHNRLYLKKIAYGYRNGRPYLKTIHLLDGG